MKKYQKVIDIIAIILLIVIVIVVGLNRIKLSDFNPINGDFQNYNPIRRFLDGQIPYKDFAVYLGTGHLLTLSFFQFLIGNTYTRSLFVTSATTVIFFELTVYIISYLISGSKRKALYSTLSITLLNVYKPLFVCYMILPEWRVALDSSITPGNSARLIRKAVIPILVLFIVIGFKIIDKSSKIKNKTLIKKIYTAIIAGGTILWSNDGGISSYIAISFVYFLLLIKEYKKNIVKILKDTFMYIVISITTLIILITAITQGHPLSWLEFTLGVSSYQKWYFLEAIHKTNISILDVDLAIENILMILIAIYYIYNIFKSKDKKEIIKYSMLSFIVISSVISTYLYQFLSGGDANEMLLLVFILILVNNIFKLFEYNPIYIKIKSKIIKIALIIIAVFTISINSYKMYLDTKIERIDTVYNEQLEGYFSKYGETIEYATERIEDEKIFSLYASAIEAATGRFQPTGVDYIIHVLGDEPREKYLQSFKESDSKYVADLSKDTLYKYWIRNANWFFYRELYKNYKPVFVTDYNIFYEQKPEEINLEKVNVNIEMNKTNDNTYLITLRTDDSSYDGLADVKLSYTSKFKKNVFQSLDINRYVYVNDLTTYEFTKAERINYNIPNESDCYYIPITIVNGYGKVEIKVYPEDNSYLDINDIEVLNTFDVTFKYANASEKIKSYKNTLFIDYNLENLVIFADAKSIKIDDKINTIIDYRINANYIILELENDIGEFAYPNVFEVIR